MSVRHFHPPTRPTPPPRGEPLVPLLRAEQALGRSGRARHLALGPLQRALHRIAARSARRLALSAARRRGAARPRGAGPGRTRGSAADPAGRAVAGWAAGRHRAGCRLRLGRVRAGSVRPARRRTGARGGPAAGAVRRGGATPARRRRAAAGADARADGEAVERLARSRAGGGAHRGARGRGGARRRACRLAAALSHGARARAGPVLPHDHLELLLADADGTRAYRLGEHSAGALWPTHPSCIGREHLDLAALFGDRETVVIADSYQDPRWPRGYFTVEEPVGAELRAVVGTRVRGPGGLSAYLLAGGIGADLYSEVDAELLRRVGGLIAAQVTMLVGAASPAPPPVRFAASGSEPPRRGADARDRNRVRRDDAPGGGPGRAAPSVRRHALRDPAERGRSRGAARARRAPSAAGSAADSGRGHHAGRGAPGRAAQLVPARGGRGAAARAASSGRAHPRCAGPHREASGHPPRGPFVPAQQLADIVASHLELLRRTALLPPPYLPGWKKVR